MLLDGKVAIVSGVGPGLGQANARALAREGATVVLAARNAEYLEQVQSGDRGATAGARWRCRPTSSTAKQVDALVGAHRRRARRLDILVNNAFRMDRGRAVRVG